MMHFHYFGFIDVDIVQTQRVLKSTSDIFLKADFSDESLVHLFSPTRCRKFCYLVNLSAVNCLERDANFPNFI